MLLFIYLVYFCFFLSLYQDHGDINTASSERRVTTESGERTTRGTTATIDVRKATDGIDDGIGVVNLTERCAERTNTCNVNTQTYPSDRSREPVSVREP